MHTWKRQVRKKKETKKVKEKEKVMSTECCECDIILEGLCQLIIIAIDLLYAYLVFIVTNHIITVRLESDRIYCTFPLRQQMWSKHRK